MWVGVVVSSLGQVPGQNSHVLSYCRVGRFSEVVILDQTFHLYRIGLSVGQALDFNRRYQ